MKIDTYKLKVIFLTEVLGGQPDREVATRFLTGKATEAGVEVPPEELDTLAETLEKGTTTFHHQPDGTPILWDYQVKGFLKEAGRVLNGKADGKFTMPKAMRSKVDSLVFISPRQIKLNLPNGGEMTYLERPLRAETAQGPRVALARSEMLPIGTWFECGISVIVGDITENVLRELLDYGYYKGLGQWRNGRWGSFSYTLTKEEDE